MINDIQYYFQFDFRMIAYLGKSGSVLRIVLLVLVHFCGKLIVDAVNYESCKYDFFSPIGASVSNEMIRLPRGS